MRFHKKKVNGVLTEELAECGATIGACPNGGDDVHIEADNVEDAYRQQAVSEGLTTLSSKKRETGAVVVETKTEEDSGEDGDDINGQEDSFHQDPNRDKNVDLTLDTLKPREFDVDENGHVVIPEDLREELLREIDNEYITPAQSEDGSLVMLKYSKSAMYDQQWNSTTVNFRGVLTDSEYRRVYARGFTKFFNVSEHEQRPGFPDLPTDEQVVLAKKMDGSLGLITHVDGENRVFTSGSARRETNEIAFEGEKILNEQLNEVGQTDWRPPENVTVLGEVISEKNPIVVDYQGQRRLVVLGAVDNRTGKTLSEAEVKKLWPGEHVEKINDGQPMSYDESLAVEVPSGEEGYVLEFQGDHADIRAKVKGSEYIAAHRVMTNMSAKNLWESISEGEDEQLLATVKKTSPKRAYDVLEAARDSLLTQRDEMVDKREQAVHQAIAQYNAKHNRGGKFALTADDVAKEDMQKFVGEIKAVSSKKGDFVIDIMIAKGNREGAQKAALKQMRPHGAISITSLVSAEESEVGDDADDNLS